MNGEDSKGSRRMFQNKSPTNNLNLNNLASRASFSPEGRSYNNSVEN